MQYTTSEAAVEKWRRDVRAALVQYQNTICYVNPFAAQMNAECGKIPETKKEEEMTEFHTERDALSRDLRKSYAAHLDTHSERYHAHPSLPKTMGEAIQMVKDDKFDGAKDEKFLSKKYGRFDGNPLYDVVLREHPHDVEGHNKATEKLDDAYRHLELKVRTHEPTKVFDDVTKFKTATFH